MERQGGPDEYLGFRVLGFAFVVQIGSLAEALLAWLIMPHLHWRSGPLRRAREQEGKSWALKGCGGVQGSGSGFRPSLPPPHAQLPAAAGVAALPHGSFRHSGRKRAEVGRIGGNGQK